MCKYLQIMMEVLQKQTEDKTRQVEKNDIPPPEEGRYETNLTEDIEQNVSIAHC